MGRAEVSLKIQLHFHRKIEDVEVRLKGDPNGKLRKDRFNNLQGPKTHLKVQFNFQ